MDGPFQLRHIVSVVPSLLTARHFSGWQPHPCWELLLVERGVHRVRIAGRRHLWSGAPGACLLIPPGLDHLGLRPDDFSTAICVVQWSGWSPVETLTTVRDSAHRLLLACRWLQELLPPGRPGHSPYHHHLLGVILAEVRRLHATDTPADDPLERLRQEIERLADHALNARQLAASVDLSPRQLNRIFQARYRCTPLQYLTRVRVDRALGLLRASRLTLAEIAPRVGLGSAAHLGRLLKRATGLGARDLRGRG